MKKTYIKALILLAALTAAATTSSCDDTFEVVETGERIEDVVEITVHDVEVDWDWYQDKTVGKVAISSQYDKYGNPYYIKAECPDWLKVEYSYKADYANYDNSGNVSSTFERMASKCYTLIVTWINRGNYSENPREGVVTITVANAPDEFVEIDSGGKVEIPRQEIKKSFTVRQAARPASDPDVW